jgi:hypothetical protein
MYQNPLEIIQLRTAQGGSQHSLALGRDAGVAQARDRGRIRFGWTEKDKMWMESEGSDKTVG